ncbi:hypothetical protein RvVAR031_30690 [Agrobacterium vitis]|nr:hypothetical protein RvVAR031_30690 [Agrobacterium vitis]
MIGEVESRNKTTALAFKPKLWTYAKASPTPKNGGVGNHIVMVHRLSHKPMAEGCLLTADTGRLLRSFDTPGSVRYNRSWEWFSV